MGLDMYLYKKTYVGNQWRKPENQVGVDAPEGKEDEEGRETSCLEEARLIKKERISEITEQVGYWRKANAIHAWIVNNVANGVDDCNEVYLAKEDMERLLEICKEVVKKAKVKKAEVQVGYVYSNGKKTPTMEKGEVIVNADEIRRLLPTQEGFFFGGTDYNNYYLDDVKHTIKVLETALEEGGDYYYQASW